MPTVAFQSAAGPVTFKTKRKMAPKKQSAEAVAEVLQKRAKKAKSDKKTKPDVKKKQKRVAKILADPTVQENLKKKITKKRDRAATKKIEKAGGDDSSNDARQAKPKAKRQKKEITGDSVV